MRTVIVAFEAACRLSSSLHSTSSIVQRPSVPDCRTASRDILQVRLYGKHVNLSAGASTVPYATRRLSSSRQMPTVRKGSRGDPQPDLT